MLLRNKSEVDGGVNIERYPITERDKELIALGLDVLANNFDDGVYNYTVGCAILCKSGNIYKGVNCDGIHGSCAEYSLSLTRTKKQGNCLDSFRKGQRPL